MAAAHSPSLAPRESLTPTPYAITAGNVTGVLPNAGLSGTYGAAVILSNAGNGFAGNGSGLVNLNANNLAGGTVSATALGNAWKTTGNAATIPGANFIGTTDNQPLDLRVNNARAIHVQPVTGAAPTIVGGSGLNSVETSVKGAVIGGGDNNLIGTFSDYSIVSGGNSNQIVAASLNSTIGGGLQNTLLGNDHYSTIASGEQNQMDNIVFASSIGGGEQNELQTYVQLSSIAGGYLNQIQYLASYSSIGGGQRNLIQTNAAYSALGGGLDNAIGANYSSIGSGFLNNIAPMRTTPLLPEALSMSFNPFTPPSAEAMTTRFRATRAMTSLAVAPSTAFSPEPTVQPSAAVCSMRSRPARNGPSSAAGTTTMR